jgi:uncharacterized protein (DUF305 family)
VTAPPAEDQDADAQPALVSLTTGRRQRGTAVLIAVVLIVVAITASAGLLVGQRLSSTAGPPSENSVDVGFARDMRDHHAQAVQMSVLLRDRTSDPEATSLALDVLLTQQNQAGQMFGWLADWGVAQSSPVPPMQWMAPSGEAMLMTTSSASNENTVAPSSEPGFSPPAPAGSMAHQTPVTSLTAMPGMASEADLQRLSQLSGTEAERFYLQLMIPHHRGAVAMATVAATDARRAAVRRLAQSIVDSQTAEISTLQQMLDARGGPLVDA